MANLKQYARGHVQRMLAEALERHGRTGEFGQYMRSQCHYDRYLRSFRALFGRIREAGIGVKIVPGKLGGFWTAYAVID